jgi:hypothetical protein
MLYPKDKIISEKEYYALTFTASKDGEIYLEGQTMWVGFTDEDRKIELREFSTVIPDSMADFWIRFEMPFCVVNDIDDFIKWYISGGHALVIKEVATDMLPFSLKPSPAVKLGSRGFNCVRILPDSIFKKAPSPKKRMDILKRDNFKCRVCGRKPDDNVDIQLHVHHIRPYAEGGFTHEDNLITLCHTCHSGLDPHYEWSLYSILDDTASDIKSRERQKYIQNVENYRNARKKDS